MKKCIYKKLNILFSLVLVFVCAFSSFTSSASQYEYAVWFDSAQSVNTSVEIANATGESTIVSMRPPYQGEVTYGTIKFAQWRVLGLRQFTDLDTYTRFKFYFNGADLVSSSEDYYLMFAFSISTTAGIVSFPSVCNLYFTNSFGESSALDYYVDGNVAYIRDYVKQTKDGDFSLDIRLGFPFESETDATFFNITTVRFIRPYDLGDVAGSIQSSTNHIINEVGDGTISNNVNNANSGLSSNKEIEQNILGSIPDMNNVVKPNYDTNLGDLTASFSYLGNAVSGFIDSFGGFYNKLWWTLIGLGLFGSICGIVIMITKRSNDRSD